MLLRRVLRRAPGHRGYRRGACALSTPYQVPYFNEHAGGSDHAQHLLLDSNLDLGQNAGRLKAFMETNGIKNICLGYFGHVDPHLCGIDYTFSPARLAPGDCAISENVLAGYP